jgi:hypothetical protein
MMGGLRSFLTTELLILDAPFWIVGAFVLLWAYWPVVAFTSLEHFAFTSFYLLVPLAGFTLWFERRQARKLAFIALLPRRTSARWLAFVPVCALALAPAVFYATRGRLPPLVAFTTFGCALWTVAVARWGARDLHLAPLVVPLFGLAPLAGLAAYRAGGWWASVAASVALAVVGLAMQPPAYVGAAPPGAPSRPRRQRASTAPRAVSSLRPAGGLFLSLCTAGRIWLMSIRRPRIAYVLIYCFWAGAFMTIERSGIEGVMALVASFLAFPMAKVSAGAGRDFLQTRPFTRAQLFAGGVLPWVLLTLLPFVILLRRLDLTWFEGAGWDPIPEQARYLRHVVGATFLPREWPAGRFPVEMWPALRALLWQRVAELALLALAVLFAVAGVAQSDDLKRPGRALLSILFAILTYYVAVTWTWLTPARRLAPVFPLLVSALLAAVALWQWQRLGRARLTPSRAAAGSALRSAGGSRRRA